MALASHRVADAMLRRCQASWPEQTEAIRELRYHPHAVPADELESIATWAHDQLAALVAADDPCPEMLAHAVGLAVAEAPELPDFAQLRGRVVLHRPCLSRHRVGWAVLHETAEYLLRQRVPSPRHVDVQRLTLALVAPRVQVLSLVRRVGLGDTERLLRRSCRHLPTWAISVRTGLLWLAEQERGDGAEVA